MKDVEDVLDDHPSRGSPMGASDRPPGTCGKPPAAPTCQSGQNLAFSIILAPGGAALSLSEISDKVPTICHNVGFS